jgi:hypothetical protein
MNFYTETEITFKAQFALVIQKKNVKEERSYS